MRSGAGGGAGCWKVGGCQKQCRGGWVPGCVVGAYWVLRDWLVCSACAPPSQAPSLSISKYEGS